MKNIVKTLPRSSPRSAKNLKVPRVNQASFETNILRALVPNLVPKASRGVV